MLDSTLGANGSLLLGTWSLTHHVGALHSISDTMHAIFFAFETHTKATRTRQKCVTASFRNKISLELAWRTNTHHILGKPNKAKLSFRSSMARLCPCKKKNRFQLKVLTSQEYHLQVAASSHFLCPKDWSCDDASTYNIVKFAKVSMTFSFHFFSIKYALLGVPQIHSITLWLNQLSEILHFEGAGMHFFFFSQLVLGSMQLPFQQRKSDIRSVDDESMYKPMHLLIPWF